MNEKKQETNEEGSKWTLMKSRQKANVKTYKGKVRKSIEWKNTL